MVTPDSFDVKFTSREVSAWGGLALLKRMLDGMDFKSAMQSWGLPKPDSNRSYAPEQLIEQMIVSIWCGAARFCHAVITRLDSTLIGLFGWGRAAGLKAIVRLFQRFDQASAMRVQMSSYQWLFNKLGLGPVTLDVDSSVLTRWGSQIEGGMKGYNPKHHGRASHHPLLAFVADWRLVARTGTAAQRAALLAPLIDGSRKAAFAYLERGRRYALEPATTTASRSGAGWKLDGEKLVVVGAPVAEVLVVSARTGAGTSLFMVERGAPGVGLRSYRTVDGQRAGDLELSGVVVGADALLGADGTALPAIEEAVDFATALVCADAVGAMKYANDATLEYLKTRKQFGVAIGGFQALQHRMVDMFIACEQARSMAILAACRVDEAANTPGPAAAATRKAAVSAAMVRVADAARLISQESVQLHGGMGMTEEMKVSHTFRRLTVLAQRFGDADHHLERYAALT